MYWKQCLQDWIWWRNHVVAPFSEEFTFRACMVPVLLGHYTHTQAIVISPLFFGVAHFHHMVERIRKGQEVLPAFLVSVFQFSYTTVFGMYSALLFVKTGHFAAPFVVHAYCNFMGFPDFGEVVNSEPKKRTLLTVMFVLGAVLFYLLLGPLTNSDLYSNRVYTLEV
jgi:prenyl protein peptidase